MDPRLRKDDGTALVTRSLLAERPSQEMVTSSGMPSATSGASHLVASEPSGKLSRGQASREAAGQSGQDHSSPDARDREPFALSDRNRRFEVSREWMISCEAAADCISRTRFSNYESARSTATRLIGEAISSIADPNAVAVAQLVPLDGLVIHEAPIGAAHIEESDTVCADY